MKPNTTSPERDAMMELEHARDRYARLLDALHLESATDRDLHSELTAAISALERKIVQEEGNRRAAALLARTAKKPCERG